MALPAELKSSALRALRVLRGSDSVRADQHGGWEGGQDDVFVVQAVFGALLGAPLAHADAVAPAVAFHEPDLVGVVDDLHEGAVEARAFGCAGVDGPAEFFAAHRETVAADVGDEKSHRPAPAVGVLDV